MWRLLRLLFIGDYHMHKWKTVNIASVYSYSTDETPKARDYECECEICGTIKRFRV